MKRELRFDNRVVIVTGSGGGLGRIYALYFAKKGAKVVINDIDRGTKDPNTGVVIRAADKVVAEIKALGGEAVANYDSVDQGERIVDTAMSTFGRIDILINNAGILRDKSFSKMTDQDFDLVQLVHVKGAHRTTAACWPIFKRQQFGRIINVASSAGIYGNYGQANYSAAKLALLGLSNALAAEGVKDNIIVNTIAPFAASKMTATIMPKEVLDALKPELVVPLVAFLVHESNTKVNGTLYEVGAGFISQLRRQVSAGLSVPISAKVEEIASNIIENIDSVVDFDSHDPSFPYGPSVFTDGFLNETSKLAKKGDVEISSSEVESLTETFADKVVLISGADSAYGTAAATAFASVGVRKIVLNVPGNKSAANKVASIYKAAAEKVKSDTPIEVVVDTQSLDNGAPIIDVAVKTFGGLHVLVNAQEVVDTVPFEGLTADKWDAEQKIHLRGAFQLVKAAWPVFSKQKYGRIVNVASAVGLYGLPGESAYTSSKNAVIGFTNTIALEGQRFNIIANSVAPISPEVANSYKSANLGSLFVTPESVVSGLIVALSSEQNDSVTGKILQASANPQSGKVASISQVRWQRTGGYSFPVNIIHTVEDVRDKWSKIVDYDDGEATTPESTAESFMAVHANFENLASPEVVEEYKRKHEQDDASEEKAKESDESYPTTFFPPTDYVYGTKETIYYNLSVGAKTKTNLDLVYENHENFHVVPGFAVIPSFIYQINEIDFGQYMGENYNPMMVVHAEQYVEFSGIEIPTSGTLTSKGRIVEIVDKGKTGALAVLAVETYNDESKMVFKNEFSILARSAGNFGGKLTKPSRDVVAAKPSRQPDFTVSELIGEDLPALYRLNADLNPLHIDPNFAKVAGFKKPIVHGLLTFGIAIKHLSSVFSSFVNGAQANVPLKSVGCRFSKPVFPGETIETQIWVTDKTKGEAVFQVVVKDRNNEVAITPAKITVFASPNKAKY